MHTSSLSDFYFTLRSTTAGDTASNLPQPICEAAARLHALTGFLPDSLPLKTPANTVMIVHHKNPKYTSTIDRLLWRRLDPTLGALQSPEDLSRALPDISASLQPVCGNKADSIRVALSDLYKSSYPLFLTSTWPLHRRETSTWIREFGEHFLPKEKEALASLSKQLALPLADTSQVRIWVVGSGVPDDGVLYTSRDRSYVSMVIPARETGFHAVGRILRWYVRGSANLAADSVSTALRILERELREAKAEPALMRGVPESLIDYAVARMVADLYGNNELLGAVPMTPSYMPELRKAWDTRIAGDATIEEACRRIAASAAPPPPKQ